MSLFHYADPTLNWGIKRSKSTTIHHIVMAGLVPAIRVFYAVVAKPWMPGTRPGMTPRS
jgi:hypothetical protein